MVVFVLLSGEREGLPLAVSQPCVPFHAESTLNLTDFLSLFAFQDPKLSPCLACGSGCFRLSVRMSVSCYQQENPVVTWKKGGVSRFIGHDSVIISSSNSDNSVFIFERVERFEVTSI